MTLFKGRNEGRVVGKNSPFLGRAWLLLPSVIFRTRTRTLAPRSSLSHRGWVIADKKHLFNAVRTGM